MIHQANPNPMLGPNKTRPSTKLLKPLFESSCVLDTIPRERRDCQSRFTRINQRFPVNRYSSPLSDNRKSTLYFSSSHFALADEFYNNLTNIKSVKHEMQIT